MGLGLDVEVHAERGCRAAREQHAPVGLCGKQGGFRPRPAGSPEASLSAMSCSGQPRARASLGQAAAWVTLAGHLGRSLHVAAHLALQARREVAGCLRHLQCQRQWLGAQWAGLSLGAPSCPEPPGAPRGGAGSEQGHCPDCTLTVRRHARGKARLAHVGERQQPAPSGRWHAGQQVGSGACVREAREALGDVRPGRPCARRRALCVVVALEPVG